mmetsp:Transcript_27998/g.61804  ORF Transcript_27998/g.61804 Transcript_27998/m.61804 type:complete len:350 (+) Transcript_27998:38-1087(+)
MQLDVGKENQPPQVQVEAKEKDSTRDVVLEQETLVHRFMEWWAAGNGARVVADHPILAAVEPNYLSEIISAGAGYHNILTLDRLDGMQRRLGGGTEPALEPLRRALQTRGGAKAQARAVGMLLFKEARNAFEQHVAGGDSNATAGQAQGQDQLASTPAPGREADATARPSPQAKSQSGAQAELDEVFQPPRVYVCTASFPAHGQIAARAEPSKDATLVTTFPHGTVFHASGRAGHFLRVCIEDDDGRIRTCFVPWRINDLELLEPERPPQQSNESNCPPAAEHRSKGTEAVQEQAVPLQAVPFSCFRALEEKVSKQDAMIRALQQELAQLKGHLGSAAAGMAAAAAGQR